MHTLSTSQVSDEVLFEINYRYGCGVAKMFLQLKTNPSALTELTNNFEKVKTFSFVFPLQGRDLISLGISDGKEIGRLIKACEIWWLRGLGCATKTQCIDFLRKIL
jgi:hypothetical protein